jgi:microcystin-dependent protein
MGIGRIDSEQTLLNWIIDRFPQLAVQTPTATPGASRLPGQMMFWPSASRPDGWLFCDGTQYDPGDATYTPLYGVIDTVFNTGGENPGWFRVPDLSGRVPVGPGTHTDVDAVGKSDALAVASRTPKHSHHKATFNTDTDDDPDFLLGFSAAGGSAAQVATHPHTHEVPAFDTDTADFPHLTVNFIIAL